MKSISTALLFSLLAFPALAADMAPMDMAMHDGSPFPQIMMKMHEDMPVPTGNIDRDFIAGMIPHHQAAIDMAQVELAQGHDPKVQELARAIIKAQQAEIAQMQEWLKQPPQ